MDEQAYRLGVYWRSRPNAVKTRIAEVDRELADRLDDIPNWATVDARAAQVEILREKAKTCEEEARRGDIRLIRQRWEYMAMWLTNEAAELEAAFCHAVVDAVAEVLAVGQQRALTEARRDRDDALAETCEIRAAVGLSAAAPHDELIERLENARHIGDCTEAWRVAEDERDALKARVAELAAAVERNRDA